MRLIDADKIIFCEIDEIGGEYEPYLGCSKSQINSLPSVDAQPVIHAKWIRHYAKFGEGGDHWKCSECGAEFECFDMDFEYCPRCGAKMDEEQNNEE